MKNTSADGKAVPAYPIDEIIPKLTDAFSRHRAVILQAPPGSGKTTRVPPALLKAVEPDRGRILMLEPRRIAAVAAARWMARNLDEEPGGTIGYSIRFDSRVSKSTRIEVMTEGILARRIQSNPALDSVAMVIFDEFHERSIHSDLALALCLDIRRELKKDLKILIMSATLDAAPVAGLLDGAPVISAQGKAYRVEERYFGDAPDRPLTARLTHAIHQALRETNGGILVFLPGAGEIRALQNALAENGDKQLMQGVSLYPLYGDLPFEEQERAILPSAQRKIVLATNIAETSLTIEDIRVVIDSGLTRRLEHDPATGMNRLVTVSVSQAAAKQRAGRAGRLGPGVCYRLYSRHTFATLMPFAPPEITTSDLSQLILELAAWGVKDPGMLSWLDLPPEAARSSAQELLKSLGALDAKGVITPEGAAMARMPLHPRLGRMLLKAATHGVASLGADLAALLSGRDIIRRRPGETHTAEGADISRRVKLLHKWRKDKKAHGGADPWTLAAADRTARQILGLAGKAGKTGGEKTDEMIPRLLLFAYPDRIAKRREESPDRYVLRSGRGMKLPAKTVAGAAPSYIIAVATDQGRKAEGTIHMAEPVSEELIRAELAHEIEKHRRIDWTRQEGRISAALEERIGAIILSATRITVPAEEIPPLICEAIRTGAAKISFGREARQLQARVRLLKDTFPDENWPDLSENTLLAEPEKWLASRLAGIRSADRLAALDVTPALLDMLSWRQKRLLDKRAPTSIVVPSGRGVPVDYASGDTPVLAVKLQEMFGLADTPTIAGGRVSLLIHLLSPAGRPVQITRDLSQFWNTGYQQVKKELRGRYPKHPWPDDPWSAPATKHAKKRGR